MTLDIEKLAATSPLLTGDGLISVPEAAKVIGLPVGVLLGELLHDRAAIYVQAGNWKGWCVPDLDDISRDYDGTFILNDVEDKGTLQAYSGPLRCHDSIAAIGGLMADEKFGESVFLFPGTAAFFVEPEQEISLSASMAPKSAVERIRARLATGIPADMRTPAVASTRLPSDGVIVLDAVTAKHGHKRFSELFDLYRNHKTWSEDQKRRMATEAGLFIELMDNPPLSEIEVDTIHEYARRLSRLPTDIYLARRRFKVESLRELTEVAASESLPLKNKTTVRGHVGRIAEILNCLYGLPRKARRLIDRNGGGSACRRISGI